MKSRKHIAEVIKMASLRSGISQKELAYYLGYTSPQFVSNWERGLSNPSDKKYDELCDLLRLSRKTMKAAILCDREIELYRAGL